MTLGETSRLDSGVDEVQALSGGIHSALWVGVAVMAVAAIGALWVRRPATVGEPGEPVMGH